MTTPTTALIVGVGPGLGLSMARRFGSAGHRVALISRTGERHEAYRRELADHGIDSVAYTADVTDSARLRAVLADIAAHNRIELAYYGPAMPLQPGPITEVDGATARAAFSFLWPAIDMVNAVLPPMREHGRGALLFAGGLSSVLPMPALGALALAAAALRNYAITLNAALAEHGVYAGTLTIGGLVERGDIHAMVTANPAQFGSADGRTLNPDVIADAAWEMYRSRDRTEQIFDALSGNTA
ncbi:short-chain dehydrogenase [Nocardia donostiensis]|uniref:SDR family NAD(P)-dependent oxidoreductase n=1 Tax=Nocardia donostiensis TaxID=1538463 RepID=UPI0009D91A74|nr:SDR family NAD(P)-dependent oxidoreductase [Nocardia donostiensis]OQS13003.1 short-chain dehydrogenase [Nocardia donostiensis]